MSRLPYLYLSAAELPGYLECSSREAEAVRNLGILRPCNFGTRGLSSYRPCDLAVARVAIDEAREKGCPLGSDIKPLPRRIKSPADGEDFPIGEIIGNAEDDQLTDTEQASGDEDEEEAQE